MDNQTVTEISQPLPLKGITVIEAAAFVAGPFAGMTLAEHGARVIRVDQTGGGPDYLRWPLDPATGDSLYWQGLNKGKESITLDLKSQEGKQTLRTMIEQADVFLTNYVPPAWIDEDALCKQHPQLTVARISGNRDGSTAVDYTVNAATGLPYLQGNESAPVNAVLPAWDLICGLQAVSAIEAALVQRQTTQTGRRLNIALSDVAFGALSALGFIAEASATRTNRPSVGNHVFGTFGRDFVFACGKRMMLTALTPAQWRGVVSVMELEEEVTRHESTHQCNLNDEGARFEHREVIAAWIQQWCDSRRYEDVVEALNKGRLCFGPYQSITQLLDDDRLKSELFTEITQSNGARYPVATSPVQGLASNAAAAPTLGADTEAVLASFGVGSSHD